jgi:chitodextrinase
MAAGAWTFTNTGRTSLLNGLFDLDSDTWKCALFLSTSNLGATTTTYAGVTNEHANANGYTTGGIAIALTLAGTTTVTVDITTDPVWTASGGSITARFAAIYEVGGSVLCYCLLDSTPADVTATTGNTLTVAANASGVFTLA